nr:cation transporter [Pseudoclavibacter sp. Marseille-Q3772]
MQTTYRVIGMTCGHCELSVQEELGELAGVTAVTADHSTGVVTVESESEPALADVRAAIEEAGYTLES